MRRSETSSSAGSTGTPTSFQTIPTKSSGLWRVSVPPTANNVFVDANTYRGVVLVPNETDPEEYAADRDLHPVNVTSETELDDHTSPSEYGIELPAPILTGEYGSQSWYSLIPWSDGLVCGCPYKQRRPWRAMCKHELVSTIILAHKEQYLLPVGAGIEVPQRARRFLSPTIASRHTPALP